jgi:uncharacterized membrane protein YfcA
MEWLSAAVFLVVAIAAACQMFSGIGFSLVCSPLLVLTLGRDAGLRTVLVMSILLNALLLVQSRRHIRWGDALRLLIPASVIIIPTVLVVDRIRTPILTVIAGAVILIATLLVVVGRPAPWLNGSVGAISVGAASGVFNVLAASSGPPVALFAAQRRWKPEVAMGTLQAFFLPLNIVTVAILGPPQGDLSVLAWAAGGLVLGTVAASFFTRRLAPLARPITLSLAAFGGAALIVTGVTSAM